MSMIRANKPKRDQIIATKLFLEQFQQMNAIASQRGESLYLLTRIYVEAGIAKDLKKTEASAT